MRITVAQRRLLERLASMEDHESAEHRTLRKEIAEEYGELVRMLAEAGILVLVQGKSLVPIQSAGVDEDTGHIWVSTQEPDRA